MKYLVTFRKRFSADGGPGDDPKSLIDPGDGVVEDSELFELVEPAGEWVAGDLEEGSFSAESNGNRFVVFGSESWVYTIAEGREREFTDALKESGVVLTFEEVPDELPTTSGV